MIPWDYRDNLMGDIGAAGELDVFTSSPRRIVEQTEPLGAALGLEPIANQLMDDNDGAQGVLDAVPGLAISFDPSHLQVTTHDLTDAARRLGSRTIIAALTDATGTRDEFVLAALGAGEIDMLRTLMPQGFDGDVCVEHEARVFGDKRGVDEVLAQGAAFARDVTQKATATGEPRPIIGGIR